MLTSLCQLNCQGGPDRYDTGIENICLEAIAKSAAENIVDGLVARIISASAFNHSSMICINGFYGLNLGWKV